MKKRGSASGLIGYGMVLYGPTANGKNLYISSYMTNTETELISMLHQTVIIKYLLTLLFN